MLKTLRVWKIKKEASTTAPAKAQFWKVSVAAASWWRFGSEVGPEWSLSWTRRWRLMKKYEISIISWDQRTNRKKVPVAAMALTLFHFFNPSNVLSPFWTPKLIFREVNFQYYWGRVKSHLRRKKSEKTQMSLFHWFWAPSGPTLANRGPIGRRIVERIEDREKSYYYFQRILLGGYKRVGKWSLFRIRIT